jgi:hypothetical protein
MPFDECLAGRDCGAEEEAGGNSEGGSEGWFAFAREFLEARHGSWGTGEHRFVGKVTLIVGSRLLAVS